MNAIELITEENPQLTEAQLLMCEESKRAYFVQMQCEKVAAALNTELLERKKNKNTITEVFPYWLDLSFIYRTLKKIIRGGILHGALKKLVVI